MRGIWYAQLELSRREIIITHAGILSKQILRDGAKTVLKVLILNRQVTVNPAWRLKETEAAAIQARDMASCLSLQSQSKRAEISF